MFDQQVMHAVALRRVPQALGNSTCPSPRGGSRSQAFNTATRGLRQRCTPFLTPLADHTDMRARPEREVARVSARSFPTGADPSAQRPREKRDRAGRTKCSDPAPRATRRLPERVRKRTRVRVKRLLGMASTRWICAA